MTLTQRETDREEEREGEKPERENKGDIRYQVGEKEDVGSRRIKRGKETGIKMRQIQPVMALCCDSAEHLRILSCQTRAISLNALVGPHRSVALGSMGVLFPARSHGLEQQWG